MVDAVTPVPLQFPNIGNALMQGTHARYYSQKADQEANAFAGEQAARPDIAAAIGGDAAAQGRVAQNSPTTFAHIAPHIAKLDADKRAQVKSTAEAVALAANTFLQTAPNAREAIYPQIVETLRAQGHDVSNMPPMMTESQARVFRGQSQDILKLMQGDEAERGRNARHNSPGGGTSSVIEYSPFTPPAGGASGPRSDAGPSLTGAPPANVAQAAPGLVVAPPPQMAQGAAPMAPQPLGGPQVVQGDSPAPTPQPVTAPQAPAGGIPQGFQPMGHRDASGNLVPALIDGKPVYRNAQSGQMMLGDAPAGPPVGPPVGPIASPPADARMGLNAPPDLKNGAPAPKFQQPWEVDPNHPFNGGGTQLMTLDRKTGAQLPIIVDGKEVYKMPDGSRVRYEFKRPDTHAFEDVMGPGGNIVGQRDKKTNQYHAVNQPPAGNEIDPSLRGEELFKSLDPAEAAQVQGILEGRIPLPSLSARMAPEAKRLRQLAFQADPSFDSTVFASRAATQKDMADGKLAVQRTAADKLISHIGELHEQSADLNNSKTPLFNSVGNLIAANRGDPRITKFETTKHLVLEEADKFFSGTGGTTVSGMESMKKLINNAQSPQQLQGAMEQLSKLMNGQLAAMAEQYNRGMRYTGDRAVAPESLLSKQAQETLVRIKGNPLGGKPAGGGVDLKKLYGLE